MSRIRPAHPRYCLRCAGSISLRRARKVKFCSQECFLKMRAEKRPLLTAMRRWGLRTCQGCHVIVMTNPRRLRCGQCLKASVAKRRVAKAAVNAAAYRARPAEERRRMGLRLCIECGVEFTANEGRSAICSSRCRNKRHPSSKWHRLMSLDELIVRDGGRCHICRRKVGRKNASADHLIPRSVGGVDDPINLALAHRHCNSRRGVGRVPAQLALLEAPTGVKKLKVSSPKGESLAGILSVQGGGSDA